MRAVNASETIEWLRKRGRDQAAATYRRHGVKDEVLGVSYADINALAKSIKTDHTLARELWKSGIHEARVVAIEHIQSVPHDTTSSSASPAMRSRSDRIPTWIR